MIAENPSFWWEKGWFMKSLLWPFSKAYGHFAAKNMERTDSPSVDLPVLCIGNFTLGGAGKTPVAIAIAMVAKAQGLKPGIVSRGYGGSVKGVHLVDPHHDRARDVGDEPLLLVRHAPVAIAPERYQGALKLQQEGCDFIIMDDGFQSRRLTMDYALLVVDAMRGLGNGMVFPSGPLRAPLSNQLAHTDSVLVMGEGAKGDEVIRMSARAAKPLALGALQPRAEGKIKGQKFLAFAGIGNPQKFYRSIVELGGEVVETREYGDHHFFTDYDLKDVRDSAKAKGLILATTAKDFVRLETDGQADQFDHLVIFDVDVAFADSAFVSQLIGDVQAKFRQRQLGLK